MEADSVTAPVLAPVATAPVVAPVVTDINSPFIPLPNQYFTPGCQTCSYLNIIVPYIRENTRLVCVNEAIMRENERLNALVVSLSETIATMASDDHKRKHKRVKKDDSDM